MKKVIKKGIHINDLNERFSDALTDIDDFDKDL